MSQLLKPNTTVRTATTGGACKVLRFLGGGGQGEVFEADLGGRRVALKWYFPHQATPEHRAALEALVRKGPPAPQFLWPQELASASGVAGFGYVMPLREGRYKSIVDLMKRRVDPSFRTLAVTGRELAHCFKQLHAQGLCYRDISFANVFFEPKTGEVLVCDNDNVGPPDAAVVGVLGTPGFMAPEIVRREAKPNTETDLHSLAVLLFYLLVVAHPLDGAREASVKCLDLPARERLYGTHPLFIFDPADDSNRPVTGLHNNALLTWPMLPRFLQAMFTRAFTVGLHQPHSGRVREGEWRQGMVALGDCVYYCPCGCEQFHDDAQATEGAICWHCQQRVRRPPRLRFERGAVVMLNHDTTLWPHHVGGPERQFDFGQPVAAMVQHPSKPGVWGLRNDSDQVWTRTSPDGETVEVPAGRSATLAAGTRIRFGPSEAEVVV